MDENDYFGHWSGRNFNSKKNILDKTESIGCVNRKLAFKTVRQYFRHYKNGKGQDRIIMVDVDDDDDSDYYHTNITNGIFFFKFLIGMFECGEITEDEFHNIQNNMELKHIVHQNEINSQENQSMLTQSDIDELNDI